MDVIIANEIVASSSAGYPVRGFAGSTASAGTMESLLRTASKVTFERRNFSWDFSFGVDRTFASCAAALDWLVLEAIRATGRRLVELEMDTRRYTFPALVSLTWEPNVGRTVRVRYTVRGELPTGANVAGGGGGGGGMIPESITDTAGAAILDTAGAEIAGTS